MTVSYNTLEEWKAAARSRGYRIVAKEGVGEDPYTHYFARSWFGLQRGYFGDAHGADADYGELDI